MNSCNQGKSRLELVFSEMARFSRTERKMVVTVGSNEILLNLEEPTWKILGQIAELENISLEDLCTGILSEENVDIAPESRLRAYVIEHLQNGGAVLSREFRTRRKSVSMPD